MFYEKYFLTQTRTIVLEQSVRNLVLNDRSVWVLVYQVSVLWKNRDRFSIDFRRFPKSLDISPLRGYRDFNNKELWILQRILLWRLNQDWDKRDIEFLVKKKTEGRSHLEKKTCRYYLKWNEHNWLRIVAGPCNRLLFACLLLTRH